MEYDEIMNFCSADYKKIFVTHQLASIAGKSRFSPTRRDFMRQAGGGALLLSTQSMAACGGGDSRPRVVVIGAELIGTNHPTWMAYKDLFGLELLPMSGNEEWEQPLRLNGRVFSTKAEADVLLEEMDEVF